MELSTPSFSSHRQPTTSSLFPFPVRYWVFRSDASPNCPERCCKAPGCAHLAIHISPRVGSSRRHVSLLPSTVSPFVRPSLVLEVSSNWIIPAAQVSNTRHEVAWQAPMCTVVSALAVRGDPWLSSNSTIIPSSRQCELRRSHSGWSPEDRSLLASKCSEQQQRAPSSFLSFLFLFIL